MKVAELISRLKALKADPSIPVFVADGAGYESDATRLDVEGDRLFIRRDADHEFRTLTIGRLLANLDAVPIGLRVFVAGDDGREGELGYVGLDWWGLAGDAMSCVRLRRTPPTTRLDYGADD